MICFPLQLQLLGSKDQSESGLAARYVQLDVIDP
jgi:hypothetical protein